MVPYPLAFEPIVKPKVWGGESWELADLPASIDGGRSIVANGPLAGRTLRDAIAAEGPAIMGACPLTAEGGFPLLLKYLSARENLSVQVHPDEAYARRHPEVRRKSEAWVVVEAEPGAVIYKGLRPEVTREAFARHVESGEVAADLNVVPVAPGDVHYLPGGTCHALGGGIVVAEIQTPSDTTFRVYDWGRTGRPLHVAEALQCIAFGARPRPRERPGPAGEAAGVRTRRLLRCEHFTVETCETLDGEARLPLETSGEPRAWMVLAGGGLVETPDAPTVALRPRKTLLLPAALRGAVARLVPGTRLLDVRLTGARLVAAAGPDPPPP